MNLTLKTPLSQLSQDEREQRHANEIDHRTCEIANCLMAKGWPDESAYRHAARFAELEDKSKREWG